MATQYTAGITQGQVWSADIANTIGAAWETWAPNARTAGTGTFTLVRARYARIQKIVIGRMEVDVNAIGTSAGNALDFDLPITTASYAVGSEIGAGREYKVGGNMMNVLQLSTTSARINRYDGAGMLAAGHGYAIFFIYEAA